ncbi:prephenate dehydratase domain protein [Gloeomargarita lithophora Alchichica-D10]|uniref:Prephenate dehydratase n=1 Tax=Gloeomargarita lithophora Alchichica-D10 TaxID=1188229 RepID=A0A1J0AA64_9CYAN|nr:prephenate dehydratase [Gloeomargarita lithophora]APB32822.1 prephenate dehydratase domain protein [Gloeomargarita lithophora Alchichica-D10]
MSPDPRIAYLGPAGTNSETVAHCFGQRWSQPAWLATSTIAQVLHHVAQGHADYGVVPVENSLEGSVTTTLDLLWQLPDLYIQQGLILPILHSLVSHCAEINQIQRVYSHPQALGQCQYWLEEHLPHIPWLPTRSTSEALQYVQPEAGSAAIASPRAAQLWHLPILAQDLAADNFTRFWVVGGIFQREGTHTSLAFSVPANRPGALVRVLAHFAQAEINLSRIESRPTRRSLGEYFFCVDLEGAQTQPRIGAALDGLGRETSRLCNYGSYTITPVEIPVDCPN